MEDDPLGSGSLSGKAPASAESQLATLNTALSQGNLPSTSEVNSFLRLCEKQEVSSETIAKVEQLLGAFKKSGFRMKEVKANFQALKAMEARKKSHAVASDSKPAKSPASTTSYSPALGVNIPAGTRRPQSKSAKATPTASGRARKSTASSDDATTNADGYRQGDKVVFAPFCPHRDRGTGTVVYSSHSGICVAFDSDGGKSQEWVHNEIVTRPGTARGSARKSTGGTVVKQKGQAQDAGLAPAAHPPPADEDTL